MEFAAVVLLVAAALIWAAFVHLAARPAFGTALAKAGRRGTFCPALGAHRPRRLDDGRRHGAGAPGVRDPRGGRPDPPPAAGA